MSRALFLLPLVLIVGLGIVFYGRLTSDENPAVIPSPLIGKPAPMIELPGVGETPGFGGAELADGRVKLVNFRASWCGPCRIEHPIFDRLKSEIPVFGINYRERRPEDALAFLAELGNPFERIGADPNGRAAIEWGLTGVPETYVVAGDGTVLHKHVGEVTDAVWAETLEPIVRKARASGSR